MNKLLKIFALMAVMSMFAIAGCEKEGPMEKAGETVDQAVENAKDAVTKDGPMEEAGEAVDEKVEEMKEGMAEEKPAEPVEPAK